MRAPTPDRDRSTPSTRPTLEVHHLEVETTPPVRVEPRTRRVTTHDPALVAAARLYEASFPAHEREPWPRLAVRLAEGRYAVFVAEVHGRLAGLAVLALLPRTEAAALLYLAADPDIRGCGVGTTLLSMLRDGVGQLGVRRGVLGEVERVEDATDATDARVRAARLRLYAQFDVHPVPQVPGYGMPSMTDGNLVPMHLVWHPKAVQGVDLTAADLRSLLTDMWAVTYDRTDDDPLLMRVLSSVREPVGCQPMPGSSSASGVRATSAAGRATYRSARR